MLRLRFREKSATSRERRRNNGLSRSTVGLEVFRNRSGDLHQLQLIAPVVNQLEKAADCLFRSRVRWNSSSRTGRLSLSNRLPAHPACQYRSLRGLQRRNTFRGDVGGGNDGRRCMNEQCGVDVCVVERYAKGRSVTLRGRVPHDVNRIGM